MLRVASIEASGSQHELTERISGLRFSNTNPGGDESASFTYHAPWRAAMPEIARFNVVRVIAGVDVLWQGRIEEADPSGEESEATEVTAYGLGARLKDGLMQQIYVDREMASWVEPPLGYRKLIASVDDPYGADYTLESRGDSLGFAGGVDKAIQVGSRVGAWYRMPPDLRAGRIQWVASERNVTNVRRDIEKVDGDADVAGSYLVEVVNLTANDTLQRFEFTATAPEILIEIRHSTASTPTVPFHLNFGAIAVYGDHSLALQSQPEAVEPDGLLAHQLLGDAVDRVSGVVLRRLDAQSFIIDHFSFPEPVAHEEVVEAANAFEGNDWGTWGPNSPLDASTEGQFDYTNRDPGTQHWLALRADCDSLALESETGSVYDTVKVSYEGPDGIPDVVTRTAIIPELKAAGIVREAALEGGTMTQVQAEQLGDLFLALQGEFVPARGSASFSRPIRHHRRGLLPPYYLRADGSNLRIPDILPSTDLFRLGSDPDRRTTFPIKRVEVDASGATIQVRAELDQAFDAMSILQARLALAGEFRAPRRERRRRRRRRRG